jgi:hypothetical protein
MLNSEILKIATNVKLKNSYQVILLSRLSEFDLLHKIPVHTSICFGGTNKVPLLYRIDVIHLPRFLSGKIHDLRQINTIYQHSAASVGNVELLDVVTAK